MIQAYQQFERWIAAALLVMLMIIVLYMTLQFGYNLGLYFYEFFSGQREAAKVGLLHDVFGNFLLLLIGLELMKTTTLYLKAHKFHVDVVFSVAMIAAARHAINLTPETNPQAMIGIGVVIFCLAAGYFLFRWAEQKRLAVQKELEES
ncbi:MAG: phosphate-starvation-inducible PsiE family protein [Candidatus Eiseniibacteriota bacterium]